MLTNVFNVNIMFYTDSSDPRKLKYALSLEDKTGIPKEVGNRIASSMRDIMDEFLLKAENNF